MLGASVGFKGNQGTLIAPSLTERSSRIKSEVVKGGDGRRHVEGAVEVLEDGTRQGASMHFAARDADGFFGTHTPVSWTWHFRPNANFCQIHRFHP